MTSRDGTHELAALWLFATASWGLALALAVSLAGPSRAPGVLAEVLLVIRRFLLSWPGLGELFIESGGGFAWLTTPGVLLVYGAPALFLGILYLRSRR